MVEEGVIRRGTHQMCMEDLIRYNKRSRCPHYLIRLRHASLTHHLPAKSLVHGRCFVSLPGHLAWGSGIRPQGQWMLNCLFGGTEGPFNRTEDNGVRSAPCARFGPRPRIPRTRCCTGSFVKALRCSSGYSLLPHTPTGRTTSLSFARTLVMTLSLL